MNGISVTEFDNMDYFEMLEGMSAKSREDRPKSMREFLKGIK